MTTRPVRVLTVIESLDRGGAERLVVTTDSLLDRDRFDHHVVSLFGPNPLAAELAAAGTPVTCFDLPGPEALLSATQQLRRLIASDLPDVVHTHLFGANVAGRLAAGDARVVTTLHNPDYGSDTGRGWRYELRCFLDRATGHNGTDRFLAVSDHVADDYREHMGFANVEVHHNAVDVSDITARKQASVRAETRQSLGVGERTFLVLHVGRIHPQKGQDVLIRAFAGLVADTANARLVFAGGGDDAGLRAEVDRLGVSGLVTFAGQVADVVPLLNAADAFAFPSRFEAFGIALLEAMAAGVPTVVSDIPGLSEVATPSTSIMVPPEDDVALTRALRSLATQPDLRATLGEAGRHRAQRFDAATAVNRLEEVYLEEARRVSRRRSTAP